MIEFDEVRLVDVSRHFGRRRAVSQISLTARSGDILGLLGPNGAGKSTVIGMLATLVAPTSGSVTYGGQPARELHLYPELSARQNLVFFAQLYGLDARDTVDRALTAAGLADRADEAVSGFSRGMRQRLALERALLHEPRLVLMDEPFTGLDDAAAQLITDRLQRLASRGAIVVMATHDLDLADGLISRVAIVRGGRLLEDEPAGQGLRARYRALIGN
jgi:ABC-type multidrug transport system ATPase subunit